MAPNYLFTICNANQPTRLALIPSDFYPIRAHGHLRLKAFYPINLARKKGGEPFARLPLGTFNLYLELEAHRELELARFCARRLTGNKYLSLIDIHGGGISARVAGVNVIERVVSIQPELCE